MEPSFNIGLVLISIIVIIAIGMFIFFSKKTGSSKLEDHLD